MDESKDLADTNTQQIIQNVTNTMLDVSDNLIVNQQRKRSKKLIEIQHDYEHENYNKDKDIDVEEQEQEQDLEKNYPKPRNVSRKSLGQQFDQSELDQYPGNGKRKLSAKLNIVMLQCPLCQQQKIQQQFTTFTLCSHKFCDKCSRKLIKYNMANLTKVMCPLKQCDAPLDSKSPILSYLTSDQLEKLIRIENDRQLEPDSRIEEEEYQKQIQIQQQQISRKPSALQSGYKQPKKSDNNLEQINQQQIQLSINISPMKRSISVNNSAYISTSPQKYPSSSNFGVSEGILMNNEQISQKKQDKMKMSRYVDGNRQIQQKIPAQSDPIYPYKIFKYLCAQVWLNKWSRFLKLLPISILTLLFLLIFSMLWLIFITLYFLIIWLVLIPIVWSVYQIWGCFQRSFKIPIIRKILFIVCLLGFPLILAFFYLLTLWIIAYDGLYKADMKEIVIGKKSFVLSGKKMSFHGSCGTCACYIGEKCQNCNHRRQILCFVL